MGSKSQSPLIRTISQEMFGAVRIALRQSRSRKYKEEEALLALHLIKRFKVLHPGILTYPGGENRLALASLMLTDQVCHDGYDPREQWAKRLDLPVKLLAAMRDQFWAGLGWSAVTRWTPSELNEWKHEMQVLHTQCQILPTYQAKHKSKRPEEPEEEYQRPPEQCLAFIREKLAPLSPPPDEDEEVNEFMPRRMIETIKKLRNRIELWVQGVAEARLYVGTQEPTLALPQTSVRKGQPHARLGAQREGERAVPGPAPGTKATQLAAHAQGPRAASSHAQPTAQAKASIQVRLSLHLRCAERQGQNAVWASRTNLTFDTYIIPAPWNVMPPSEMLRWARSAASILVPAPMTGPRPIIVGEVCGFRPRNNFVHRLVADDHGF